MPKARADLIVHARVQSRVEIVRRRPVLSHTTEVGINLLVRLPVLIPVGFFGPHLERRSSLQFAVVVGFVARRRCGSILCVMFAAMVMVVVMMVVLNPCGVVWMVLNHTTFCCKLKG